MTTCHEEVTRKGQLQPCEKVAVALRDCPEDGGIYPVCVKHTRHPMVPLDGVRRMARD